MAMGHWKSREESAAGDPFVLFVMGADAVTTHRVTGSKPEKVKEPSVVAYATMLTDANGDLYPAEVWGMADAAEFTISADLMQASLEFSCDGVVVVVDPVLEQEVPTGEIIPLTVSAHWIGDGDMTSTKNHSKTITEGLFTIERGHGSRRQAVVELTLTGPGDHVLFDGLLDFGEMSDMTGASMSHFRP